MRGLLICCISLFTAFPAIAATSPAPADQGVQVSVVPKRPIVIDANLSGPIGPVSRPWFRFKVNLENNSEQTVTVVAMNVSVTAVTKDGLLVKRKLALVPSDFNKTMVCGRDIAWGVQYDNFGSIMPGEARDLYVAPSSANPPPGIGVCTSMGATLDPVWLYVGGNPEAASYTYDVQLELVGWYGTFEQPTDRFQKTINFRTQ